MNTKLDVSIIIASHRPSMIQDLLTGLNAQYNQTKSFEVIIVADYPVGVLQRDYPDYLWFYIPNRSISKKRNHGARHASGKLLAFIDDDCIPATDWIHQGVTYLDQHPFTAAVEGKTVIDSPTGSENGILKEYKRLEKQGFRTNNLFIQRMVFQNVGGFDERFTVQREDVDLAFTVLSNGYQIDFCTTISVTHRFRVGEKWDLLKNCWNRRFDPLLYKKHPAMYRKYIGSPLTPTIILLSLLSLVFLGSLRNKRLAIITGILGFTALTGAGVRRSGSKQFSFCRWRNETLQLLIAPLVTEAALIYGSLRFHKLLII